jgi:ABC-type sulfate transport system permease component
MSITGIGEAIQGISDLIGKFIPSADEKAKNVLALELATMQQQQAMVQAQTDTNKAEASNASMFVAGWRPFIGWVCGSGLAYQFIAAPIATWIAALCSHPIAPPALDLGTLLTLLLGMLGLGGMRTYEKLNGVQAKH